MSYQPVSRARYLLSVDEGKRQVIRRAFHSLSQAEDAFKFYAINPNLGVTITDIMFQSEVKTNR